MASTRSEITQVDSGIPGLDELLRGGFVSGRMYLISGDSGTGKTTLAAQFLEAGLDAGDTVLYIHGEETAAEIDANASRFGIDLARADFLDLGPDSEFFTEGASYDLVRPADIEEERYTEAIHEAIREVDPDRVVIDPITQLHYIENSEYHFRKRILSFVRFLKERDITVLATATTGAHRGAGSEIRSLSDGVITLSRTDDGRRIEVEKNRGYGQIDGDHGVTFDAHGLEVFPKVRPRPSDRPFDPEPIPSGISALDDLVGGGFERGTVTFISGPPGVGKTTLGTLYLAAAAGETGPSAIYLFEERIETFVHRCRSIGIPIDELREDGRLSIRVVDPRALSAEEFAHTVREDVENGGVETVLIDGLSGYISAIQGDESELEREIHALTRYLTNREVTVFVVDTVHQITGLSSATSRQMSPIADNLLFLSYVELRGSLRKVVGVLKKRAGGFEHTLREFEITTDGIRVAEPMTEFSGILHGTPQYGQWNPPGDKRQ
ncbi:ATPase domain-containing protein [Halobellus sp. GM3]|uniref:ATPase domain-containing protein n=1 Tax=Halobellus sp. GM3 TaxID=3458410 RepID=UPI00403D9A38